MVTRGIGGRNEQVKGLRIAATGVVALWMIWVSWQLVDLRRVAEATCNTAMVALLRAGNRDVAVAPNAKARCPRVAFIYTEGREPNKQPAPKHH